MLEDIVTSALILLRNYVSVLINFYENALDNGILPALTKFTPKPNF